MDFRITGLSPELFKPLFVLDDATLAGPGARRAIADDATGFPCRVSLAHADPGEELILISFEHQGAHSPYRAAGPIYVRKVTALAFDAINVIPEPVRTRFYARRGCYASRVDRVANK